MMYAPTLNRKTHSRAPLHRLLTCPILVILLAVVGGEASAQETEPSQQMAAAIAKLVPYNLSGSTAQALQELDLLTLASDQRTATTSRFIRAAAEVDLLAYAVLTEDSAMRQALADALGVSTEALVETVAGHVEHASLSSFSQQIAPTAQVLGCLEQDDWNRCGPVFRRVADNAGASSTVARLFLLRSVIRAAEQARAGSPQQGVSLLLEQARPICAEPRRRRIARLCREARQGGSARLELAQHVFVRAAEDMAALERAGAGDDPLVALASTWVSDLRRRLGWLAFSEPLRPDIFGGLAFPEATAPVGAPPLEILIIGPREVTLTLSPTTVVHPTGNRRLGCQGEYALPGKTILSAPFSFRPVIRPIQEVTDELRLLRTHIDGEIASIGAGGPRWLEPDQRALGLVVDRRTTLVDLARFVRSAHLAGYHRFVLIGQRDDDAFTSIQATMGTTGDSDIPSEPPRLRIGPRDVDISRSEGPTIHHPRRRLERLGSVVVPLMSGSGTAFVVQGRPMMPFSLIYPVIDSVSTAAHPRDPSCMLLLPP